MSLITIKKRAMMQSIILVNLINESVLSSYFTSLIYLIVSVTGFLILKSILTISMRDYDFFGDNEFIMQIISELEN